MISDNLTIVIPTRNNSDEVLELLNQISEQTDIDETRVILADFSDGEERENLSIILNKSNFPFTVDIVEGGETPYKSVDLALDEIETEYFLVLTSGVKFMSDQTIYNCLIEIKSSNSKIIIPKLNIQSSGFVNSLIKMKFKTKLKSHPFSPLSFFFAETEHVQAVNGFTTYEVKIDEEISLCKSFNESDIYQSDELIVIPNDMEIINGYLERIKKIDNTKEN